MIHGIGVDLIEIDRIKKLYQKQDKLVGRILSANEQYKFNSFQNEQRKIEFLAGRFACKEAFSKALGTGIGKKIAFNDIDCFNDDNGKPCVNYNGFNVHVSITHTEHYAMSQVILEADEVF
ncbi:MULTISPECIES: holo-ACP synthase [Staphylococcus]|uniref:Holo-[acyl-carrier-protein] synthase n=1 Tax=Staphylococcus xylosus TaxID=1288 RepID=A0A418IK35_STAXY|nr:holo-ACP synthase [Staphylococcus xylosus]MBF0814646.1 holo-ACP synthase [Staphylococcus saprophyticus]NQD99178.1 holo-ACP synthase [Staphylococcus xylosus]RIN07343.1 holo-ACP synthase [Staphylococcus xylosus]TFV21166.1 holo-ACP synthase [Staphylococcus saprophyticus]